MLFNSREFLFAYLPIVLVVFFLFGKARRELAAGWLAIASVVFYGWWDARYVPLLLGSIAFNFCSGGAISRRVAEGRKLASKRILAAAITANLLLLGYYKYAGFFVTSVNEAFGVAWIVPNILLPLGISFFTFTQIAFLVDAYDGKVRETNFLHYVLFVTYFPHLIAGPVLHHKEMMPQFANPAAYHFSPERFTDGMLLFLLGLAKKVILADRFGEFASGAFAAAGQGAEVSFFAAWGAALSYTFQLYFDFSGYSDMAVGLGKMIVIELPINFNSPYKAQSIIDFWRRWHITLSRFLRDYLYIPLGGNRKGEFRRYLNLFITMVLGGLWHGAGWTYVIWGAFHGALLAGNHLWSGIVKGGVTTNKWLRPIFWVLTFFCVVIGWVIFRSTSIQAAGIMLSGMTGDHGAVLPAQFVAMVPGLGKVVASRGSVPYLADGTVMGLVELVALIGAAFVIVLCFPNLYEMKRRPKVILVTLTFAFALQKVMFSKNSEFLYFQF
jgi:alginate O-acetyltransferase complex protein AlgI